MTDTSTHRKQRVRLPRPSRLPRWSWLAAGALVGGLIGTGYGLIKGPVYTATSYVVAVPVDRSDPAPVLGMAQAYGRAATQLAVLQEAQAQAGVPVRTLQENVRTAASPEAPVVAISATSSRPGLAVAMVGGVVRALTRHADEIKDDTGVGLVQFAPAARPTDPTSPSPAVTGAIGASAGGMLGGLTLLVRPRRPVDSVTDPVSVPPPAVAADLHGPH
ncbi:lipopolysaccharide biosynthesis protein [Streptomyces althioticus]|uniref:lipopolysaccharide biosynthesis protein n=1 Tax=Streptomyces althioticus TaxID=83380 RepID=UPI003690423D